MILINIFLIFILGLFLGSFLNVLVDRIPKNETVVKDRSRCDKCKKELGALDLIPVVSYLMLKGKCRYCHAKLSIFYPVIEISTGTLFILTYIFTISNEFANLNPQSLIILIYYLAIVSAFIVLFFQDIKFGILADKITLAGIVLSLIYLLIFQSQDFLNHFLSGVISFAFFVLISVGFYVLTKKQGMGGGDIKLSFLLGLILGFPAIIVCFYIAFLTGAIASIILVLWRKKDYLKDSLPFGPFLIVAALISLFWGNLIYLQVAKFLGL